jgi:hypothetical protein
MLEASQQFFTGLRSRPVAAVRHLCINSSSYLENINSINIYTTSTSVLNYDLRTILTFSKFVDAWSTTVYLTDITISMKDASLNTRYTLYILNSYCNIASRYDSMGVYVQLFARQDISHGFCVGVWAPPRSKYVHCPSASFSSSSSQLCITDD